MKNKTKSESRRNQAIWLLLAVFVAASVAVVSHLQEEQSARSIYGKCWELTAAHFLFTERLGDWVKWKHKFDNQIHNADDAVRYSNIALKSLNDPYTKLLSIEESGKERQEYSQVLQPRSALDDDDVGVEHVATAHDGDVGYIRIPNFASEQILSECSGALEELSVYKAIVVDLRSNGGGEIGYTDIVASYFITSGAFMECEWRQHPKERKAMPIINNVAHLAAGKKLVVLINGHTASSAEMLAAALRDARGAKLVGTRSYGKGVMQSVYEVNDQLLFHITEGRWYTLSGKWLGSGGGTGLVPDILCPEAKGWEFGSLQDNQLVKAFAAAKEELASDK